MFDLEKINEFVPFCLSCLGRSVGLVGFGLDNRESAKIFNFYIFPYFFFSLFFSLKLNFFIR